MSNSSQSQAMMSLIDKLCDHLSNDRIKLFIDNGFDEWQTVTYVKGPQLVELGFTSQEVIVIMVAINANAKECKMGEIFTEQQVKQVMRLAKQNDQRRLQQVQRQERQYQQRQQQKNDKQPQQKHEITIKQYPSKLLTEAMMLKCLPGQKLNKPLQKSALQKVTLLQLQGKEITRLQQQEMRKIPSIQNLYLTNNHLYRIEGLSSLSRIKILRLENNLLKRIEGLEGLVNLEVLKLSENYLQRIQNLSENKRLHELDVSSQKHKFEVTFEQSTFGSLAYCLEKLWCNNNYVRNIDAFRHLAVVQEIELKNNQLEDISELTEALTNMGRIKKIDFRGNPLVKVAKYRDYIVILSKSLQQLDDKKILPKERQYLVKLYSLKHAKQQKQTHGEVKKVVPESKNLDLLGMKLEEQETHHPPRYVHGGDLRGNVTHANTKVIRK